MCIYLDKIYKFITSFCYGHKYTEYEKIKKDLIKPFPAQESAQMDKPFIVNIPPSIGDFSSDNNGIMSLDDTAPSETVTCSEHDWDIVHDHENSNEF